MGEVVVKIKIMPESAEISLDLIKQEIIKLLEMQENKGFRFEIEPIAFGLKALILIFSWPEEKSLEEFENSINNAKGVGSIDIVDMRRAIG